MKFFKKANLNLSLEELEIEKLVRHEEQNDSDLTFDSVLKDTEDRIKVVEESESEETESAASATPSPSPEGSADPGERVSGDSENPGTSDQDLSTVNPSPEGKKPSGDVEQSDEDELLSYTQPSEVEEQDISTESLRQILSLESHHVHLFGTPSLESKYDDGIPYYEKPKSQYYAQDWQDWGQNKVENTADKIGSGLDRAGDKIGSWTGSALKWLGSLGVKLGTQTIPALAKQAYKGLLYAFDRLGYSFMVGLTALERYIQRRINSFSNLHSNIKKAKETLDLLDNGREEKLTDQDVYDNQSTINQIVIAGDIDLIKNINSTTKFVKDAINGLGISIKQDLEAISELIGYSQLKGEHNVLSLMKIDIKMPNLQKGIIDGFQTDSQLLDSYYNNNLLPGTSRLIVQIPNDTIKERTEWIEAYRQSDMFIGVDRSKFKLVESIPYRNVKDLKKLLSALETLCNVCIEHQAFYDSMKKQKLNQRLVYKNYFDSMVRSATKVSIKDSMIDLIVLRNNFVDKVYLPAAIDIHDYAVRVINANLRYIEKNIKVLTP